MNSDEGSDNESGEDDEEELEDRDDYDEEMEDEDFTDSEAEEGMAEMLQEKMKSKNKKKVELSARDFLQDEASEDDDSFSEDGDEYGEEEDMIDTLYGSEYGEEES